MFRGLFPALLILIFSANTNAQSAKANELMKAGQYTEAAALFEKASSVSQPEYSDLTSLAYCYIMLHDFPKAESVYEKIISHPKMDKTQHLYYGEVLKINGKLVKAKEQYALYKDAFPEDFQGAQRMASCDSLTVWNSSGNGKKCKVEAVKSINTPFEEMSPWPSGSSLFFCSTSKILFESCGGSTQFHDPQLSFVYKNEAGKTSLYSIQTEEPVSISGFQTSSETELLIAKKIVTTANGEEMSPSMIMAGSKGNYAVFRPDGAPEGFTFSHPCIAKGGSRLYFVSDLSGGEGGTDIYYSDWNGKSWGSAINIGKNINTPGNEMFPFVSAGDSLLFFASDGHPGYGNMDIFVASLQQGQWQKPLNMQAPVNSIGNDFSFVFSHQPWEGYFVSNRFPESIGGTDIFRYTLEKPVVVKPDTSKPFVFKADPDLRYVFFKTGSAEIEPAYSATIDSMASLMKKYDNLNLHISTYADIRGTEPMNNELVLTRRNVIIKRFTDAGISSDRIVSGNGKVSADRELPNLVFHVQIGFVKSENETDYFEWRTKNEYGISFLKKAGGYAYFTGSGSLGSMKQLASEINSKYIQGAFVIVTYRDIILDDTYYAPNRRAEIKLMNK